MAKTDSQQAKEEGHVVLNAEAKDLHEEARQLNQTEGGACLTGHEYQVWKNQTRNGVKTKTYDSRKESTCNYRYQSMHRLRSGHKTAQTKELLHEYPLSFGVARTSTELDLAADGSVKQKNGRDKLKTPNSDYGTHVTFPQKAGDWHIDGPRRGDYKNVMDLPAIPQGMNFITETWPYWNNAHHILPKGSLKSAIVGSEHALIIQRGLLNVKYNVNHHNNLLLMPQDLHVAKYIGILRHLQLKHQDTFMVSPATTNHPVYNRAVESKLTKIIGHFEAAARKAIKKAEQRRHAVPNAKLGKKLLEDLSDHLFKWIYDHSKASAGRSLDVATQFQGMNFPAPGQAAPSTAATPGMFSPT
ncbi:AHH domain-containing protein [Acanthopleuribacter pedis]|uniref:AHH domain-containing protein n=1 Tax=Acanthopleuribacter pedis TaxID=442870 RepID=A0A8J7QEB8_9BACT|nr:AHH domain-containing protein [Acanthopleuribacter pedis]MBO1322659.1 AHH domain-containing protein [Acanthopleuribacter pedis]